MKRNAHHNGAQLLVRDIGIMVLSILVAIILARTHALSSLISYAHFGYGFIESFLAGIFFTSVFTTPPAIVALAEISKVNGIFETALWGALGSIVGDFFIYTFIKDQLAEHVMALLSHQGFFRRIRAIFRHHRSFRTLTFILGGLLIASPLPDELGIALLGFSKMRTLYFLPLAYVFNFIGIYLIGMIAAS